MSSGDPCCYKLDINILYITKQTLKKAIKMESKINKGGLSDTTTNVGQQESAVNSLSLHSLQYALKLITSLFIIFLRQLHYKYDNYIYILLIASLEIFKCVYFIPSSVIRLLNVW